MALDRSANEFSSSKLIAPLDIIPVIDLQHGLVVRARAGERDSYRPIETPLAASADPAAVAEGLLAAIPVRRLYVADLDAIAGAPINQHALRRIAAASPGIELWVDAGFADERSLSAFIGSGIGRPVLGSESQHDTGLLAQHRGAVLSLDFRGEVPLGPRALHDEPALWTRDVIVMTLARVGAGSGPDFERIASTAAQAPHARIYAAGGLRGPDDLAPLRQAGAVGALVASAIHDGRLLRAHLAPSG